VTHTNTAPPPPDDPTRARIVEVHAALDAAIVRVRQVKDAQLPVPSIEHNLGLALQQVYGAMGARGDWGRFREKCANALELVRTTMAQLMAAPSDDPAQGEVLGLVAGLIDKLSRVGFTLDDAWVIPSRERGEHVVWATLGVPRLYDLPRSVMRAAVPIDAPPIKIDEAPEPPPPPPPATMEAFLELVARAQADLEAFEKAQSDALPPPAPAPAAITVVPEEEAIRERFGVKITDFELLVERAKDCMDDLAMLGRMRRPSPDEPWASGDDSEDRMLTKLDAIVACGVDVYAELVHMLDDRPLPDPELTFGNVFFLCCVAGDDTFDEAVRLVELCDLGEPEMLAMVCDAFTFATHPRIDPFFSRWLSSPDVNRRALAAEVLRRRRVLAAPQIELLAKDGDERVLASAVRALVRVPSHGGLLSSALGHSSDRVLSAALETSMLLRVRAGYERAVELVRAGNGDRCDAIMYVAIAGGREARELLELELASRGHPASLRAIGWYGDVSFVPFLLGRLENGEPPVQDAALDALERLTGASITDVVPEPRYQKDDLPFARARRDFTPTAPLSLDPAPWRAWWKLHGHRAVAEHRYRWGHRWSPQDNLWELWQEDMLYRDRPFAAMELAVRSSRVDLDWDDWVIRQRAAISQERARPDVNVGWGTGLSR
jgi:hypothetical protein